MVNVSWRTKFMNWLLSEQVYYNLQTFPLLFLTLPILWLLLIDVIYVFWVILGYGIWVIILKYLKMTYEEKYKIFRYLYAIVYDIDHHKATTGWIDVDISETYPIELGEKDKRTIEIAHLNRQMDNLNAKKDNLLTQYSLLKTSQKMLKRKVKSKKKEKKKKKKEDGEDATEDKTEVVTGLRATQRLLDYQEKIKLIAENIAKIDDERNKFEVEKNKIQSELEAFNEKVEEEALKQQKINEEKKKIDARVKQINAESFNLELAKTKKLKEKEIEEASLEEFIDSQKSNKKLVRDNDDRLKEIDYDIYELQEKIDTLSEEKIKLEEKKEQEMIQEKMLEDIRAEYPQNLFQYFRSQIAWSDIYDEGEEEIIFILPSEFDDTFVFTNDTGNFANLMINVPAYSIATFVEVARFKNVPYLLCVFSSYHIKNSGLTKIKKEIAEKYTLDAKLSFLADEISMIHYEYETLKTDNLDLENHNNSLLNELMKVDKRKREKLETMYRLNRVSYDMPPKRLYAVTILGWILFILFFVLFIFYPIFFNPNQTVF